MKAKGTMILIGGAEDKGEKEKSERTESTSFEQFEILKDLMNPDKGKQRIEIITTASEVPDEIEEMYRNAFERLDFADLGFIHIRDGADAGRDEYSGRIERCHAVFFSGGDQYKLVSILTGTSLMESIRKRYEADENFLVAGTSAGAMALPDTMICESETHEAILKKDVKISKGLGLLERFIVDTHFLDRGRFGRLAHAVARNQKVLGMGIGENTAVIIHPEGYAECNGSGMVVIVDAQNMGLSNVETAGDDDPIFVENLKVHLLSKGCKYSPNSQSLEHTKG